MARASSSASTTEISPLLGGSDQPSKQPTVVTVTRTLSPHQKAPSKWRPTSLLALTMVLVATVTIADGLSMTPLTRLFESVVCYQYWEVRDPTKIALPRSLVGPGAVGGVAESLCKIQPVQAEVATLKGWQIFFDGIPSLVMALPIGAAADRIGRKPIIFLGCLSLFLKLFWTEIVCWFWQSLPIRLVWISALHGLISGSSTVLTAIVLVLVSDVTDATTRTTALLRIASSNMVMYFVAPPLGAALMAKYNPWIPLFAATLISVVGVLICYVLPETLNYHHSSLEHQPLHPRLDQDPTDLLVGLNDPPLASPPPTIKQTFMSMASSLRNNMSFLVSDSRILLMFLPFVAIMIAEAGRELLVQYASVRYGITMARATYFASLGNLVKTVTLLVLVPGANRLLSHYTGLSAVRRDLHLARASISLMAVGWVLTGLAPTLPLFVAALVVATMGYGAASLCRSLLTGFVAKHHVGKLYTAMSIVETLALMGGGPVTAGLWDAGLGLGGRAVGLPFLFLGVVWVFVIAALCFVQMRKGEGQSVIDEEEAIEETRTI
ncbi:MFS general substrate transporter [Myriangium duriaei CBS 260.36]|uniref:MFS general substrate transporter n=1 Tax=Myriangium duriaei CBS 260.36 TaxID=1168546 RepID=A0A9P4J8M0_9PEZI|nr:MFS general substrate transporter [Myriangium duriaei CBS 260.36]